jgi:hypothetical protein
MNPFGMASTFLYFGLRDLHDEKIRQGTRCTSQVEAIQNPTDGLTAGSTLTYLPKSGDLNCGLLEQIRIAEAGMPEQADVLQHKAWSDAFLPGERELISR